MQKIQETFQRLSRTYSDIYEHLPTLSKYASECKSVLELGVRGCISSWAFVNGLLASRKDTDTRHIFLNDIVECTISDLVEATKNLPIQVDYEWKNDLELEFSNETRFDLTFIDTWHVYGQLKRELEKFAPITNKYLIMHDTTVDAIEGESIRCYSDTKKQSQETGIPEDEIRKGLWPAVEEFLQAHPEWLLEKRYENCNGLTILKRVQ